MPDDCSPCGPWRPHLRPIGSPGSPRTTASLATKHPGCPTPPGCSAVCTSAGEPRGFGQRRPEPGRAPRPGLGAVALGGTDRCGPCGRYADAGRDAGTKGRKHPSQLDGCLTAAPREAPAGRGPSMLMRSAGLAPCVAAPQQDDVRGLSLSAGPVDCGLPLGRDRRPSAAARTNGRPIALGGWNEGLASDSGQQDISLGSSCAELPTIT